MPTNWESSNAGLLVWKVVGINGIVTTTMGVRDAKVAAVAIQADSKILVAGYSNNGQDLDFALTRYDINHKDTK